MSNLNKLFSSINEQKSAISNLHLDKEEVLSKYDWTFGEEIVGDETITFLKEQTFKIHNSSNNFYTELGSIFKETQEKLSSRGDGVFGKWIENIGFKRTNVFNYIKRYEMISQLSVEQKAKVEALPLRVAYELTKDSYPDSVKEMVISGEITKFNDLKKMSIKKETTLEVKDVSSILILNEVKEIIDLLAEKESRFKTLTSGDVLKELRKAKKIIKPL